MMSKGKIKSLVLYALIFALLVSCCPAPVVSAQSETERMQAELDALSTELDTLKTELDDAITEIEELRRSASTLTVKSALDARNALMLRQVQNLERQIEIYGELTTRKALELGAAGSTEKKLHERFRGRMRFMEENGSLGYPALILGADSIPELISILVDITDIVRCDKKIKEDYQNSLRTLRTVTDEYKTASMRLAECRDALNIIEPKLKAGVNETSAIIAWIKKYAQQNPGIISAMSAQGERVSSKLRKKTDEGKTIDLSAIKGSLVWPVESTYITSLAGTRVHPVTGVVSAHEGVDVGADYGSPVCAAASGYVEVSADGWNGGYGSCIAIDHENGIETLYAHLSIRLVDENEYVTAGQLIGYTGDSGKATGPHLHYELLVNGTRRSALGFYPDKSFSYSAGI